MNGNESDSALLRKYKNQVKLLTEEVAHHENEQSVRDWQIDELKVKLRSVTEELKNVKQDLAFETQRSQTLEEANSELQLRLRESKSQQTAILQELEQLKSEKRVISERIRQSYVELGIRRKISTNLIPDNNSDEEYEYKDGNGNGEDHDVLEGTVTNRRISSRKFSSKTTTSEEQESSSFDEWSDDEVDELHEIEHDGDALEPKHEPAVSQTLLQQYETLIDDLQHENEKLVAQLRIQAIRTANINVSTPLRKFLHETYPVIAKRPTYILLWQPWFSSSSSSCPGGKFKPVSMGVLLDIDM